MLRKVLKPTTLCALWPLDFLNDNDKLRQDTPTEQKVDLSTLPEETGWDRLKRVFEADDFGEVSKELLTVLHVGGMSLFVGGIYGGVVHSRVAYVNFMKNNQATAFTDHLEAKKKLQDAVTKSFGKGAWMWSWRLASFTMSFTAISTGISVYRGKSGILEYVVAGLFSGTLYKWNMGPRGWVVGGGLGAVLGLIAGGATLGLLSLTGMSMDEVRYWQYHWQRERQNYTNKGIAEYLAKEEDEVVQHHNKRVGNSGKTLENVAE
ncbi:RPII140-upstream gene protein [Tribolium castaneum]|uniref:Complex I assembly factor TIMMDC1, mitochondrial n=1 Tax=Tribolium castaneum TaxID=7070 RepID=D6X1W9_TRICA|nr:PREDICTED: RPII140-upstream gene protein [Tribolium castaneum]EFA10175.1 RPII140-upstream gene protein-like Protein [Tribolium castaneum]|eukprot:XP_969861.1 PREDICTED: RPII140-upstream gene protein [Tribolium castaneum]